MTQRPRRQKKHDPITYGGAPAVEVQCDMATAPFDHAVREAERTWGVDRLPDLVTAETAARWGLALGKLNEALAANDPEQVKTWVNVCIRGIAAMDAEARAAGHQPSNPDIWEIELDGKRIGIIRDGREWPAAQAKRPDLSIFNLREVAVALMAHRSALEGVLAAKAAFPGAEVAEIRTAAQRRSESFPDDPIPFGQTGQTTMEF